MTGKAKHANKRLLGGGVSSMTMPLADGVFTRAQPLDQPRLFAASTSAA